MKPWRWIILLLVAQPLWAWGQVAIYQESEDHYWVGLSFSQVGFEPDDSELSALRPVAANLRLGGRVYDYLGVEMRGGVGIVKDRERNPLDGGGRVEIEQKLVSQMSVMLVGMLPITQQWSARGYLGGAMTRYRTDAEFCDGSDCESSRDYDDTGRAAWGVGALWRPVRELGLTLEYIDYGSPRGFDLRAVEVGAMFFF